MRKMILPLRPLPKQIVIIGHSFVFHFAYDEAHNGMGVWTLHNTKSITVRGREHFKDQRLAETGTERMVKGEL